jgi:beta-amylase
MWEKYGDSIASKSELGNTSHETVSVWATQKILSEYQDLMNSFRKEFIIYSPIIDEINISLGPAGEMRFPSYNAHDPDAKYPSRGRLQAYSSMAIESFQQFMNKRYQTIENLNSKLGFQLNSFAQVYPPSTKSFFEKNESYGIYGKDFYDWYSASLQNHGRILISEAIRIFRSDFPQVSIGFKIPGVHWRAAPGSDRLAELAAGLITTSDDLDSEATAHGYKKIIDFVSLLKKENNFSKINLHFTCLEMDNYEGPPEAQSFAKALVFWVGHEASRQNVRILGENALSGTLSSHRAWENMQDALIYGGYQGLTILRMGNLLNNTNAGHSFYNLVQENKLP